ncbi:MAG TPA: hypothetical protein VMS56_15860 [Thermoanaerobaculia bacterium]|nr:hypothetical protein [Thermoanaerobaculia bacterium]
MIRACVVVGLSLSLLPLPLTAQCEVRSAFDGRFRETALDVSARGSEVLVASSHGVARWHGTATSAAPLGSIGVPDTTVAVAAVEGGAWAASGDAVFFIAAETPPRIVSSLDLGARVSDVLPLGAWVWAATSVGIVQIDAIDPARPSILATLPTTAGGALSLAAIGETLYAADGDRSVEAYTLQIPAFPQKIGTFDSLPRSISVRALGSTLAVSDGQQTELFSGSGASMARSGIVPVSGTAAAVLSAPVHLMGGGGTTLEAVDLSAPSPTVLATLATPLTEGPVNRISAVEVANGIAWAAAGDSGLAAWSLAGFQPPYPLRSVKGGAARSASISGPRIVVAPQSGGLQRWTDSAGRLTPGPAWGAGTFTIHDRDEMQILVSSGAALESWDPAASPPALLSTATLRAAVRSAVLTGARAAVAVLVDGSVWRVDLGGASGTISQAAVPGSPAFVARGGEALALGSLSAEGTTAIRYYAGGDLSSSPVEAVVEGVSNGGIALSPSGVAAAATFRGIILVDFAAGGAVTIVPGSAGSPVRDLHVEGEALLVATDERIEVRSLPGGALVKSIALGETALSVHASSGNAVAATPSGFTLLDLETSSSQPQPLAVAQEPSRFFRKMARDGDLLWLAGRRTAELHRLGTAGSVRWIETVDAGEPFVDVAALGGRLFTLSAGGTVRAIDASGRLVGEIRIDEGDDQAVSSIDAVGGALWVSLTRGCLSGACEKRTVVIDARSGLGRTAVLPGGVEDVVVRGGRAFAIFDLPAEVRVYRLDDPAQPVLAASTPSSGNPVSIELAGGSVWALGSRLYRYGETLVPAGELLDPHLADPAGRFTYLDQQVRRLSETCLVISGRSATPRLYEITGGSLAGRPTPPTSGAVVAIAVDEGSAALLGETSLELWTTASPPSRHRPTRK